MIYKLKQNRVGRTYLGGSRIDRFTGRMFDNHGDIPHPEDWLASVTSVVNGGVSEGLGCTEEGISIKEIIGDDVLPILVKLLDSDERLVLQAHPTVKFAKENGKRTDKWLQLFIAHNKGCQYYVGTLNGETFVPERHGRMPWNDSTYFAPEALIDGKKGMKHCCPLPATDVSGSPILQNGKIAGAVTHILVNGPARGYGIVIENML